LSSTVLVSIFPEIDRIPAPGEIARCAPRRFFKINRDAESMRTILSLGANVTGGAGPVRITVDAEFPVSASSLRI